MVPSVELLVKFVPKLFGPKKLQHAIKKFPGLVKKITPLFLTI